MTKTTQWIVELEPGVWIADIQGDPGRTLQFKKARRFASRGAALWALKIARKFRRFPKAQIHGTLSE